MIKKILNFFFIVGTIVLSRKILEFFLYLIYLILAVLVLIYFFFYHPYIETLKENIKGELEVPKNVATSTIEDVSYIYNNKKSGFLNFSKEKKEGVIRIGAFGDSYTQGDEVDYESDYPSILQELFIKNGYENVEVLNFGSMGWGNFSSFRLWELEGRKYDLDFILFGPYGFWLERDLIFNWEDSSPMDIHGRYILEKNNIKYIQPLGGFDVNERFKAYYSFIPKLSYLLYDKNPPTIIKSLLKENKTIDNPFYYHKGELEEEYSKIYGHLFKNISKEVKQIINIVGKDHGLNFTSFDFNKINNFYFTNEYQLYNDSLKAPMMHAGVLRNNLLAQEYFNVLTKKEKHNLSFIKTEINISENTEILNLTNLYDLNNITIDFGDIVIGKLISNINDQKYKTENFDYLDPVDFFKDNNIKSLLCLKTKNKNFEESLFLPLDFKIESGMELHFPSNDNKKENKVLGEVKLISDNIGIIESDYISFYKIREFEGQRIRSGELILNDLGKINVDSIYLGEEKIYSIVEGHDNKILKPNRFNHFVFRSETAHPRHIDEYDENGNLFLSLRKDNQILERHIIGSWEKDIAEYPINHSKIEYFIGKNKEGDSVILENN